MSHERTAAGILERLRKALELVEEVEFLIARDGDVLHACSFEAARDICRTTTALDNIVSSVRWGTIGRGDRAFLDGDKLARGRHEYAMRWRPVWKRRLSLLEAKVRDLREAGRDNIADWYESQAEVLRGKLAGP